MSQQIRIFLILIRLLIAQSSQYVTVTPGKRGGGGGGGAGNALITSGAGYIN